MQKKIVMEDSASILNHNNLEFVVFCIENVASKLGISGDKVFDLLNNSGLLYDYIVPNYDILHTQSKDFIIDDIIKVMREKGLV